VSDQTDGTQRDVVMAVARRKLPMPRTPRELFELLEHLTPERDLDDVLDMVDFAGIAPGDVYLAILGRAAGDLATARLIAAFDPRMFFKTVLLGGEFRQRIMAGFLLAYPEKARDVFIHVPKCAGTDLIINLASRQLPMPKLLEAGGWLTDAQFLLTVGGIARLARHHDRIFVHGHMELGGYIYDAGVRSVDRIFTVIRDPLDQMLSQANYAIGRLRQDPRGESPDTALILESLGIPRLPEDSGNRELKDLGTRALLNPDIAQPNRACTYLGRGMEGTYASAIDRIVVHNVEITTTKYYDRWLLERWGISVSKHHNRSEPILSRNEVQWLYASALEPAIAEDRKLFDLVGWALEQTGNASVTGMEIARLAGDWLLDGLPASLAKADPVAPGQAVQVAKPNLLAAEELRAVNLHLQPARAAGPDSPSVRVLTTIDFGENGTGRDYQLDGWSVTERTFTWTNAYTSRLELPPMPLDELCVLQLIGNPYVETEQIPFQQVEVSVNGTIVGEARVRDIAVIECELPRHLLRDREPVEIALHLPTAARPKDLSGIDDDRLLAFALHRIVVMTVRRPIG
jgi:hypothetical protein